jgi:hypothetical protein
VLDAAVQASVGVDREFKYTRELSNKFTHAYAVLITPEVNLGIKVSHKSIKGDLLNAQVRLGT